MLCGGLKWWRSSNIPQSEVGENRACSLGHPAVIVRIAATAERKVNGFREDPQGSRSSVDDLKV
jgi:hypothetical protein